MKLFSTLLLLLPLTALAHIEDGVYEGKDDKGATCEMKSNKTYLDGTLKHPLNERVELIVNNITFIVQHPAIIDETKATAGFDHDQFKGVTPNKTGADALVIKMVHTEDYEGPSEYYFINHQYNPDSRHVIKCSNLTKK